MHELLTDGDKELIINALQMAVTTCRDMALEHERDLVWANHIGDEKGSERAELYGSHATMGAEQYNALLTKLREIG